MHPGNPSYTYCPPPRPPASTSASGQAGLPSPVNGQATTFGQGPTALVEEPEAISPDSDQTVSPIYAARFFSKQGTSSKRFPGQSIQRMDTLPPQDIVADIPSPPVQPSNEPSGNPHGHNEAVKRSREELDDEPGNLEDRELASPALSFRSPRRRRKMRGAGTGTSNLPSAPTQSPSREYLGGPPGIEVNGEDVDMADMDDVGDLSDMIYISDHSTPPQSSIPSTENTPDTRLTESSIAGSPSPPPHSATESRISAYSPQPGQSPGSFVCDTCHRAFDQIHKLK